MKLKCYSNRYIIRWRFKIHKICISFTTNVFPSYYYISHNFSQFQPFRLRGIFSVTTVDTMLNHKKSKFHLWNTLSIACLRFVQIISYTFDYLSKIFIYSYCRKLANGYLDRCEKISRTLKRKQFDSNYGLISYATAFKYHYFTYMFLYVPYCIIHGFKGFSWCHDACPQTWLLRLRLKHILPPAPMLQRPNSSRAAPLQQHQPTYTTPAADMRSGSIPACRDE